MMKVQMRNVVKLIAPIFVFPVLFIPYALLNSEVLVKWLGCGCPKIDASGEEADVELGGHYEAY